MWRMLKIYGRFVASSVCAPRRQTAIPRKRNSVYGDGHRSIHYFTMADTASSSQLQIAEILNEEDFGAVFEICAKAFGEQTADGIWTTVNPAWDTVDGKAQGAARLASRWRATKRAGHTRFIKASVTTSESDKPRIVGIAIWINASLIPGCGDPPDPLDFTELYPNDEETAKFLVQIIGTMQKHRRQVLHDKARPESAQKSVMVLDLCALDPAFQRRGIASALVQWGLDEAQRLGDLEAITEASAMGRSVYKRLGFQEVVEIEYEVDAEFRNRSQPSNMFLRTRPESISARQG